MSYDLVAFDPDSAPGDRVAFLAWYEQQTEWAEERNYDDPAGTTPALAAFFHEMIATFPAMNGPFAVDDDDLDDARVTDYCIGSTIIYASFAWSEAEAAYATMRRLATKHNVGFFNASADDFEMVSPPAARPPLSSFLRKLFGG